MIDVKTASGFVCSINENALDDAEILEALCELDENNPVHLFTAIRKILGEEQKAALYDRLRTEDGRVPIIELTNALSDIINGVKDLKK